MKDFCYDDYVDLHLFEPRNQASDSVRKPPDLTLGTIVEEDRLIIANFTITNETGQSLGIEPSANECMRLWTRRYKSELEIHAKKKGVVSSELIKELEDVVNFVRGTYLLERTEAGLENGKVPTIPPLPEVTINSGNDIRIEAKTSNDHDLYDEEKAVTSSQLEPWTDINMGISDKAFVDCMASFSDFNILTKLEKDARDSQKQCGRKFGKTMKISSRKNFLSTNSPDDRDPAGTQDPLRSSGLRQRFEDSLTKSAQNFFDRVGASSNGNNASTSSNSWASTSQLLDTNPFKSDLLEVTSATLPGNNLPRTKAAPATFQKTKGNTESQFQATYEAKPIMYNNLDQRDLSVKRNVIENSENIKEDEILLEAKKSDVEMWIAEHGYDSNKHFTNNSTPPPLPPRRSFATNSSATNEIFCNGTSLPSESSPDATFRFNSSEWLETIENTVAFKKNEKSSGRSEKSRITADTKIQDGKLATTQDNTRDVIRGNSLSREWTFERAQALRETLDLVDAEDREKLKKRSNIKAIQITNRVVFLITYQNGGWLAFEELAIAFANIRADQMMKILASLGVDIPLVKLCRWENLSLFNELDRSSLSVPRDQNNKIADLLVLAPLLSALKILLKLKIINREQVDKASKHSIFPKESPVLYDLYKLINAWGEIKEEIDREK